MVAGKFREIIRARAKLAALEQSMAGEINRDLAALPAKYGFASVDEFIAALRASSGKRRGRKPKAMASAVPQAGVKRRKRAVVTDATRASVKQLVKAGKTGAVIANALGISMPTVHNIKKALGLVRTSGAKAK